MNNNNPYQQPFNVPQGPFSFSSNVNTANTNNANNFNQYQQQPALIPSQQQNNNPYDFNNNSNFSQSTNANINPFNMPVQNSNPYNPYSQPQQQQQYNTY